MPIVSTLPMWGRLQHQVHVRSCPMLCLLCTIFCRFFEAYLLCVAPLGKQTRRPNASYASMTKTESRGETQRWSLVTVFISSLTICHSEDILSKCAGISDSSPETHDSPMYICQVPGLYFINDLRLHQHRLPRSYLLSQQISHSCGELWLCLYHLWGLLVHYKRAERVTALENCLLLLKKGNKVIPLHCCLWDKKGNNGTVLPFNQNLHKLWQPFLELRGQFPSQHQLLSQVSIHPKKLLSPNRESIERKQKHKLVKNAKYLFNNWPIYTFIIHTVILHQRFFVCVK